MEAVTNEIRIMCDSDMHARGKPADVVDFFRNEHGTWDYRPCRGAKRRRADSSALFACPLCRATLPPEIEERKVLIPTLDELARHEVPQATIRELISIASNLELARRRSTP